MECCDRAPLTGRALLYCLFLLQFYGGPGMYNIAKTGNIIGR